MSTNHERRNTHRFPLHRPGIMVFDAGQLGVLTHDVSRGGVRFEVLTDGGPIPALGTKVKIEFPDDGSSFEAHISWCRKDAEGTQFLGIHFQGAP